MDNEDIIFFERAAEWVDRGGGVRTWYLVTRERGANSFLTGISEFDKAGELPFHWHNCSESVVVLEGMATYETANRAVELRPAESTWITPGVAHRFRNSGESRLRILWIYDAIDATRTLASTGDAVEVGTAADRHWS